ncbi:MAG: hypothetical protein CMH55_01785 [Myxococcales bacterium]|nr:hypothetical protein [Myxococcales bacterium]
MNSERSPWIVSPRFDLSFFLLGAWLVPILLWAGIGLWGLLTSLLIFRVLDYSHIFVTWPFTFGDRETMTAHGRWYRVGFLAIVILSVLMTTLGRSAQVLWWSVFIYWGAFHIIRQHYGFLRIYQARQGATPELAKAEVGLLYSGTAFPYLLNLSQGWALDPMGDQVFQLPVPAVLAWGALGIFVACAVQVAWGWWCLLRSGRRVGWQRLLHLVLAISNFWVGLLWAGQTNAALAALFITSYHDLQYHGVIWWVGQRRYRRRDSNPFGSLFTARLPLLLVGFVLAAGCLHTLMIGDLSWLPGLEWSRFAFSDEPGPMMYVANFFIGTVAAHYLFDGKMWKMSENPRLRQELDLSRPSGA